MPKFDDSDFNKSNNKRFIPKKYRAWDHPNNETEVKLDSNQGQTEVKLDSNQGQTGVKLDSNQGQTEVKLDSNQGQTEVKLDSNQGQTEVKLDSNQGQTGVKLDSNQGQTGVKYKDKLYMLSTLSPLSKLVIEYIYAKIYSSSKETNELKISDVAKNCHTTINGAKVTIKRLINNNYVSRVEYKGGKFGWSRYKLNNEVLRQMNLSSKNSLLTKTSNKNNQAPIYNSNINTINKYNKKEEDQSNLINPIKQPQSIQTQKIEPVVTDYSSEWDDLDLSPLESNGMKKSHIQQLKNIEGLTPDMVQESINHYSWALDNDPERMKRYAPKQNQLKGLMGCLKKGNPWTEGEYIDPIEEAMQKSIEAKKKRIERLKAQKEEMFNLEYEEWEMSLSVEEKTALKKKLNIVTMRGGGYKAQMRTHFRDNIYKG